MLEKLSVAVPIVTGRKLGDQRKLWDAEVPIGRRDLLPRGDPRWYSSYVIAAVTP